LQVPAGNRTRLVQREILHDGSALEEEFGDSVMPMLLVLRTSKMFRPSGSKTASLFQPSASTKI
jgi:hypothetical protein